MEKKKEANKFSIVKLLLTILCTTIVSAFIGFTILFIEVIPSWMISEVVMNLEKDSEVLVEIGKEYEEKLELTTESEQGKNGENYPSKGILLYYLTTGAPSRPIVEVYAKAFLIGIALGTIIYIVAVQNRNEKKMIIELIIAFIVLVVIVIFLNLGYEAIINKGITELNAEQVKYSTYIYDLESNEYLLIQYVVVATIIYIVNMIRQKIIANKLNKELKN